MKLVKGIGIGMLLFSAVLWAQTATTSTSKSATTTTTKKAAAKKPAVAKKAEVKPAATAAEIKALQQAMAAQQKQMAQQQQQIQELRDQLGRRDASAQQQLQQAQSQAADAQAKATAAETASNQQKQTVGQIQSDLDQVKLNVTNTASQTQAEQKRISTLEGVLARFRFSGDLRVRQEDFFPGNAGCIATGFTTAATCTPRVRERVRARLNIDGKISEDFVGGLALASGIASDPTSTNETLTSAFERKSFLLDRAFITYQPQAHKWLQLTGGKFAYTWVRTPQTFDSDLNPEGFSEKLSFDFTDKHLKNVTFTGIQLMFNENNSTNSPSTGITRGEDSYAVGGQASVKIKMGRVTFVPSYTILNWRNTNVLVNGTFTTVVTAGTAGPPLTTGSFTPTTQIGTVLSNVFPNGNTNALRPISGGPFSTFASKFLYSDLILDFTVDTGMKRLPLRLVAEYLDNLNAVDHPFDTSGNAFNGTGGRPNLGKQSHLYKGELTLGQLRNRNDVQFGYGFWRQEQDSVLASFNESDQRAPTNILQHFAQAQYQLRSNLTLGYTLWVGRLLVPALTPAASLRLSPSPASTADPYLKRMQFDAVYKF